MSRISCDIPLNRVEGDLTLKVDFDNNTVSQVHSTGTLYRGFEKLMKGRSALDGLVITPRICGICSLSHLTAASKALDQLAKSAPPANSVLMRNIAGIMEVLQSDLRQTVLMYMPDFTNPIYNTHPMYPEMARRYSTLMGSSCVSVIKHTSTLVEIIAILGGQWPHTSFMVPGGVTNVPTMHDLIQCRHLITGSIKWYEKQIIGCSLERLNALSSLDGLNKWLDESESHRNSDLGYLIRFGRSIGLNDSGRAYDNFISYGAFDIPEGSRLKAGRKKLIEGGFAEGTKVSPLDHMQIEEHIDYSWYTGYEGGRHPFEGLTEPEASGFEGRKYSWVKAPRYNGKPAETGPLAQAVINGDPLFCDMVKREGGTALARQLARLMRPAKLFSMIDFWLGEIADNIGSGSFYESYKKIKDGKGAGLADASRGALGHWINVKDGSISRYQIITPTAWNGSPRDSAGVAGPWEKALEGVQVKDTDNPVEIGHVVRSFDPCLVCAVHRVDTGKPVFRC